MKAEVVLTPTESKKLISDAVLSLDCVKNALENGTVAIHPSSSTVFIYEKLTGRMPGGLFVCGVVNEKGLAGSLEAVEMIRSRGLGKHDPREVSKETWVFEKGELRTGIPLGEILDNLTGDDVYIKGCNALDPYGKAGVLFSNPAGGGGTIGKVMAARRKQDFRVLFPVGLEKLIPVSINEAAKAIGFMKADLAMGIPAALFPVDGTVITEVSALEALYGVRATPISAGSIGGTGGCVTLVIEGEEPEVRECFSYLLLIKGAKLPELHLPPEDGPVYPKLSI
ncbi:MAG: hypothetical protein IKE27_07565 [Oscillospiraceae bacterium]|nr:hypothetical protein [Oscillospiraceae bacterium]